MNTPKPPAVEGPLEPTVMALVPKRSEPPIYEERTDVADGRLPPNPTPNRCCGNCEYFLAGADADEWETGECRRYPPTIPCGETRDPQRPSAWHRVFQMFWCGEYERRHNAVLTGPAR